MAEDIDLDFLEEVSTWAKAVQKRVERPANSVTLREYMAHNGVAENAARRHLQALVDANKLYASWAYIDGIRYRVFVKVESDE